MKWGSKEREKVSGEEEMIFWGVFEEGFFVIYIGNSESEKGYMFFLG